MKLIFVDKDTLWCGTQASLEAVLAVQDKLLAGGFDLVAETVGAGGRGYGLKYRIYQRREGQAR